MAVSGTGNELLGKLSSYWMPETQETAGSSLRLLVAGVGVSGSIALPACRSYLLQALGGEAADCVVFILQGVDEGRDRRGEFAAEESQHHGSQSSVRQAPTRPTTGLSVPGPQGRSSYARLPCLPFALVRMRGKGKRENWLLIKGKDEHARSWSAGGKTPRAARKAPQAHAKRTRGASERWL